MYLICKRCGSDRVAQKPVKGLPNAVRNYCPDCGNELGYITPKKYWEIREKRSKELKEMAKIILLVYVQHWEQTKLERLEAITSVANKIGVKKEEFIKFQNEIHNIYRGRFEGEIAQIIEILEKYKKSRSWIQKILNKIITKVVSKIE